MSTIDRCVPPIRWLRRWFIPEGSADWQKVAFQPMLFLCLWLAALIILVRGDFRSVPAVFSDKNNSPVFWVWVGLSLVCPPLGLVSLRMIRDDANGRWKYRGFWFRLAADIGQLTALTVYTVLRFQMGDYHIYPVACLVACTLFVAHLVMRDVKKVWQLESLARALRNDMGV